jgi:diguanylate cyclase (GGDEF)-like protein
MPPDDWNLLHHAVVGRLRLTLIEPEAAPVRAAVEDCMSALDLLHDALAQERGYMQRVETELKQHCSDLAALRAKLAESQAGERRAQHQAQHDSLTTLPNRGQFHRKLDDALSVGPKRKPVLAVLFLDLDDFKPINDRHGHETGDRLLRVVARRLSRAVRAEDVVCRLGGDEFACLLSQPMGPDQLSRVASQIFDTVSAPVKVGMLELSVRPSIGIAVAPKDGHTADVLLHHADAAMYHAKRRQLGFAFFDGQQRARA